VRRALVPLVCLLAALVVSGCGAVGRVTNGDPSHGKQLFSSSAKPSEPSCASCHTLADAKSQGTVGPNLDDAFSSDKSQGFSEQTIRDVVRGQIAYPEQPMPANLYRGQDARDVASYVAKCAANPACGVTASNAAPSAATTTAPTTTTTPSGGGAGAANTAVAAGKKVFASAGCGGCHTLKDAGSSGNVGPNLDQLKPAEAIVEKQVTNGGGPMPAFKNSLTAAQIKAVATYVSSVAGK
jgi:mono/diheme cytochrome c family protein